MRIVPVLVLAPWSNLSVAAAEEPQSLDTPELEWTGSVEQKVWGLMTLWAGAKYAFPFFDRIPCVDWDAKAQQYIPRVIAAPNIEAYYRVPARGVEELLKKQELEQ